MSPAGHLPRPANEHAHSKLWLDAGLVTLFALALSAFHWLKLRDLTGGDNVRWFLEAYRAASGEQPYRDFSWLYPPAGLWVFAAAMKVFGGSFAVIQSVLDLLSWILCLLVWRLARRLLPRAPALGVATLFAAAGASNTSDFALFSLDLYAPGLLTGTVGLLAFLYPLASRLVDDGAQAPTRLSPGAALTVSAGATLACLSKLEIALGIAGGCLLFPLLIMARQGQGRWFRPAAFLKRVAILGALAGGPALIVLAALAARAGARLLLEALSGYGVGGLTCPWWPTGLGLLSIVGAWARALVFVATVSLVRFRALTADHGRRYAAFLVIALVALGLAWLLFPYSLTDFSRSQPKEMSRLMVTARYLMSLTSILHPVMWGSIALALAALSRLLGRRPLHPAAFPWLFLVSVGTLVSSRSLFGDLFSRVGVVSPASYPVWFVVLGGALLMLGRLGGGPAIRWYRLATGMLFLYACLRLVSMVQSSRGSLYRRLETEAGPVRLRSYDAGASLYRAVIENTAPTSRVLEVPFGGGLVFAGHRKSSLFLTQFVGLFPSPFIEKLDEDKLLAEPPDLVVAEPGLHFAVGKGVALGCGWPRFTFAPPSHDPLTEPEQPSMVWIEHHYRVVFRIADKLILVPVWPGPRPL